MRRMRWAGVLLLTALGACDGLATGVPFLSRHAAGAEDVLRAKGTPEGIRLTNEGRVTLYYHVIDGEIAPRALWGPCLGTHCPRVEPGAQTTTPWPEYEAGRPGAGEVALVYWWYLVNDGRRGLAADSLRVVPVRR
jgi:hypothetical protein